MQVRLELKGHLTLAQQLRYMRLDKREKARIHRKIGAVVADNMKRKVSWFYRQEYPDDVAERRRLTKKVRAAVGRRASARGVTIFDREEARAIQHDRRKGDAPTDKQIEILRGEVGFRLSAEYIRARFTWGLAGAIIRRHRDGFSGQKMKNTFRGGKVTSRRMKEHDKSLARKEQNGSRYYLLTDLMEDYMDEIITMSRIGKIIADELKPSR
ncbi:MAG: hypothetical protein OEZ59_04035 [Deltaproteobacteria bacterium]|nr:hypothetical protein [Deltaproteobacteria bacterium]